MRSSGGWVLRWLVTICGALALGDRRAEAQMSMSRAGRSLGGYGASASSSYGGGGGYVPYSGGSGYVPFRGGSAGGMGVQPLAQLLPQTPIGGVMMAATPIGGASLSAGMGVPPRGGMSMAGWTPTARPLNYGGLGVGGMGLMSTSAAGMLGQAPAGPGLGYPFRMPPPLPGTSSMSMP